MFFVLSLRCFVPALLRPCAASSLRSALACLSLCLSLAFCFVAPNAWAGSYVGIYTVLRTDGKPVLDANGNPIPTPYSGGHYTIPGSNGTPTSPSYAPGTTQNLATGYGGGSGGQSASCTGPLSVSWKWTPDQDKTMTSDPPPSQVIIMESSSVKVTVVSPAAQGTYDTGFGDGKSGSVTWSAGGSNTMSATSVRYTATAGGASVTLKSPPSPSAVAAAPGNTASVRYTASISSVFVVPGGTVNSNGTYSILIGQQCTATLSAMPTGCTAKNLMWSISGNTLQGWTGAAGGSTATTIGQANPYT